MKTFLVMLIACTASASADALMSRGMHQVGDVSANLTRVLLMFRNPLVWASIACSATYFFLYSSALSWAKLSEVQPLNAMTFLLAAGVARIMLGEAIPPARLAGIILIAAGVALVSWNQG